MLSMDQPDQAPMDAGTYRLGETLKASSTAGYLQKATSKGDEVIAIVATELIDTRTGLVRAAVAGERLGVWRLGCQKTVKVRSLTGVSWSAGNMAYQDDTDGQVSKTATTSRPIGHYPEYGIPDKATIESITGRGTLVYITLDVAIGTTNV